MSMPVVEWNNSWLTFSRICSNISNDTQMAVILWKPSVAIFGRLRVISYKIGDLKLEGFFVWLIFALALYIETISPIASWEHLWENTPKWEPVLILDSTCHENMAWGACLKSEVKDIMKEEWTHTQTHKMLHVKCKKTKTAIPQITQELWKALASE